jgi:hypothetical protein
MNADAVALLVMLAGAELVQQVEGRRRVVMQDEDRVPAIFPSRRALAHDDGADGMGEVFDHGGRLGDLDLLGLGADVSA